MRPLTALVLVCVLAVSACGSKSPTTPTNNPPPPPATTRIIGLQGNLDFGAIQLGQSFSATLAIGNSGNAPLTVTGLTSPGANTVFTASWTSGTIPAGGSQQVTMRFTPVAPVTTSGTLTVNADHTAGTNTIPISGRGTLDGLPVYVRTGVGANVFDTPSYLSRVRITGTYTGRCENFIIYVSNRLVVNEILGTCSIASGRNYDGTHQVTGGAVRIESSTGITWTLTEVR